MKGDELRDVLGDALGRLESARDELRDLDAAIGDGDLGITVAGGAAAVREELESASGPATPAEVLRAVAKRFASANPSTMSALVASALLAAAKAIGDTTELDRAAALTVARTAADRIAERGGAQLGDKTLLDALVPSVDALRDAPADAHEALDRMIEAARDGVESTTALQSQRGRAAWVGERSIGHPDGGATAYLRFLESLRAAWPSTGT
jgi:dihydroxyacetone kinase-like protein